MSFYFDRSASAAKRIFAAALAAALVLVVLCSAWFLAADAGHDCSGEDCEVCVFLEECRANIRRTGFAPHGSLNASGNPV